MAKPVQKPFFQLQVGKSVRLRDIRLLARDLDQSPNATTRLLRALRVPIMAIKSCRVYNEAALETAIFAVTSFGGPGLAAPASLATRHSKKTSKLPRKIDATFPHSQAAKAALAAQKQATAAHTDAVKEAVRKLT